MTERITTELGDAGMRRRARELAILRDVARQLSALEALYHNRAPLWSLLPVASQLAAAWKVYRDFERDIG